MITTKMYCSFLDIAGLALLLILLADDGALGDDIPADSPLVYETLIEPIFRAHCTSCHGSEMQKAELDLTTSSSILRGSESGRVIVSRSPAESRLFDVIEHGEMPPEGEASLSSDQIELIRRWILEWARFRDPKSGEPQVTHHDIVPLMFLRCTVCHGTQKREAGLDLRTKAGMLRGGESGPVVVAGRPDESLLVQRIVAEEMPPRRRLVKAGTLLTRPLNCRGGTPHINANVAESGSRLA